MLKTKKIMKFIKKSVTWYILLCIFFFAATVVFCIAHTYYIDNIWLSLAKDISVIVASTFGVSLLIGLLIEKNSKEDFYVELIKDTIKSESFEKRLSEEEKNIFCNGLFKSLRCNHNEALFNIYSSFEKRFVGQNFFDDGFYFDECEYRVTCSINEDCIEKNFVKSLKIKSYSPTHTLKKLKLGTYQNKYCGDKPAFELKSLAVNGRTISDAELETKIEKIETKNDKQTCSSLDGKAGYTNKIECFYDSKIVLNNTTHTTITYNYITRTDLTDNYLTVRCSKPCRNFKVDFTVKGDEYEAHAVGFGFIDKAQKSPNGNVKQDVAVRFDDWILPEDGVVIMINKT